MKERTLKVSSVLFGLMLILPVTYAVWGLSSANQTYDADGNEHPVSAFTIPVELIDGVVANEWPANSNVGHLWCTSEENPVGDVFVVHDEEMLFIGVVATYPGSRMAEDGHWVKIDWNRDSLMDLTDNMGNNQEVIFEMSDMAFEYQIPLDTSMMVDDKMNILLHAELLGIPGKPDGETTTFPFRPPGKFLCTTLVLLPPEPNVPPVANIGVTVDSFTAAFDGSGSYDPDGTIVGFEWDFGDGATDSGMNRAHTYSSSGDYTVSLIVTDNEGAVGTDTCLVTIINVPPVPDAGEDQTVLRLTSVQFDGSGSYDVGGHIISYSWDFGDGLSGSGEVAAHIFYATGDYTVTLTVTDNEGASASDTCLVTVLGIPELEYSLEYLNPADQTLVDAAGIHFWTSGAHPEKYHFIPYNQSFHIPQGDWETYYLYNHSTPLHFRITLSNTGDAPLSGLVVRAIQERHNDVTIWDSIGELTLYKGQVMDGNSTSIWMVNNLDPGETITLEGFYWAQGRGWGLDQTHLIIKADGNTIVDDSEAGVYCPP